MQNPSGGPITDIFQIMGHGNSEKRDLINRENILHTFDQIRIAACHDTRDLLYAIRALLPIHIQSTWQVDYRKCYEEVCTELAVALLSIGNCTLVQLLQYAEIYPRQSASLPSWIPDWRAERCRHVDYDRRRLSDETLMSPVHQSHFSLSSGEYTAKFPGTRARQWQCGCNGDSF